MRSPRNAVGVVHLIAQGGRGTSLPWVNGCRGFNAVSVEFSLRKHGYSEGIHGELRLESVTPTALKHSFYNTIKDNIRINKWQNVETFQ